MVKKTILEFNVKSKSDQLQRGEDMMTINKKLVVDEHGNPKEVIIQFEDFKKIEELLGLDLDENAIRDLQKARRDRESGNLKAYVDLDSI